MTETIRRPRGLPDLLDELAGDEREDTFSMRSLQDDVLVEVALGWADGGGRDARQRPLEGHRRRDLGARRRTSKTARAA